jgi:propanol-preferring alcohol dehydrogenase
MHAYRLIAPHTVELRSIPQPEPGPGEVLVRIGAAGVCHSDLHIIDAPDALGVHPASVRGAACATSRSVGQCSRRAVTS